MRTDFLPDGSKPKSSSRYINIYACVNDDHVDVMSRKVNLSLSYIEDTFISRAASKMLATKYRGKTPDPAVVHSTKVDLLSKEVMMRDKTTGRYYAQRIGGLDAVVQLMYDNDTGNVYYVDAHFPWGDDPKKNAEIRKMINSEVESWIRKRTEDDSKKISFYQNSPVPYKDYEVHKMSEYIGVYDYMQKAGLNVNLTGNEKVLLVDCSDRRMARMAREQIGFNGDNFYCVNNSFSYSEDGSESVRVTPPFYFVNSAEGSVLSVTSALIRLITRQSYDNDVQYAAGDVNMISQLSIEYIRNQILTELHAGQSIGDMANYLIGSAISESEGWINDIREEWMERAIEDFGVRGMPVLENFAKSILLMGYMFGRSKNRDMYSEKYYYVAKRRTGTAIAHENLFNIAFTIVDTIEDEDVPEFTFDVVSSWYVVPAEILEWFGYESVCDQKVFSIKTNIATTSVYHMHGIMSGEIEEDEDYEFVKRQAENSVVNSAGSISTFGGFVSDQFGVVASVKLLSEYPMIHSEVLEMFAQRDLSFRDIWVFMMFDELNPGTKGAYYLEGGEGNETLSSIGMRPPYIVINLYQSMMRSESNRVATILHEASHYIDDILVRSGVVEQSEIFHNMEEATSPEDYWTRYLGMPTEFTAHFTAALQNLKRLDPETVARDRDAIKPQIVRTVYLSKVTGMIPITEDVAVGAVEISASPQDIQANSHLSGQPVDIVEEGTVSMFYKTGVKRFDTIQILSIDEEDNKFILSEPVKHAVKVSNGAHLNVLTAGEISTAGLRWDLYSEIVDRAIDYYVNGGDPAPRE